MQRRVYLATVGGALTTGLAGCVTAADLGIGGYDDHDIGMTRNEFTPDEYQASVGDTVVWKNTGSELHTVTAYEHALPDGADFFASGGYETEQEARDAWNSEFGGGMDARDTFEHTFEVPGVYSYFCIPHEMDGRDTAWMLGLVEVTE